MPAKKAATKASAQDKVVDDSQEANSVTIDRRRDDRREGDPEANDVGMMKTPRRKKQRRRHIDPTTCERDYNNQEIEFMRAMDDYKRSAGRMFPTCSEVLEVVRALGYVKLDDEQMEILGLGVEEEVDDESSELDPEEAELQESIEA